MNARARVERTVIYPVGREEVWAALTKPAELSRWFGMEVVTLELRPAGRIVFRGANGELHRAMIETVEAPQRLAFRWLPALAGHRGPTPATRVELVLETVDSGTALTVVETPWLAVGEMVRMAAPRGPVLVGQVPADPPGAPPTFTSASPPASLLGELTLASRGGVMVAGFGRPLAAAR